MENPHGQEEYSFKGNGVVYYEYFLADDVIRSNWTTLDKLLKEDRWFGHCYPRLMAKMSNATYLVK